MKIENIITKEHAINIILEMNFKLLRDTDEGAIFLNIITENEVEFFCDEAVFLIDVIKWLYVQIKIETEILKNELIIPQNETNQQF